MFIIHKLYSKILIFQFDDVTGLFFFFLFIFDNQKKDQEKHLVLQIRPIKL